MKLFCQKYFFRFIVFLLLHLTFQPDSSGQTKTVPCLKNARFISKDSVPSPRQRDDDVFEFRKLNFFDPLCPNEVLVALFRGNIFLTEDESGIRSCWTSPPTDTVPSVNREDEILFPFPEGNDTRLIDTLHFWDEFKNEYILFSYSTVPFSISGDLSGRFECGILGLALFGRIKTTWELIAWNPRLVCLGSFQKAPAPTLVYNEYGKRIYSVLHSNGGPGGPFFGDLFLIGEFAENFKIMLKEPGASLEYLKKNHWTWSTTFKKNQDGFQDLDLFLSIEGEYSENESGERIHTDNLTQSLKNEIYRRENFRFSLTKKYNWTGVEFKLLNEELEVR